MTEPRLQRLRRLVAMGLLLGILVVTGLLMMARWPAYWTWVAPEQAPVTFFQVALLLGAAFSAALLCFVAALRAASRQDVVVWAVLATGFVVLALDDQFYLHQRLRDVYLAPLGVGLPWGSPGDYVLVVYAAAGLVFLPLVLRLLATDRFALALFVAGVVLTAAVVAADTFDVERMTLATERLQQTLEEVAEGLAAAFLASALISHAINRLADLAARRTTETRLG